MISIDQDKFWSMAIVENTKTPETTPEPMDKKIIHPIFLECTELTLDPYWKQIFEDCARGKFPTGSSIDNAGTTLYFKTKNSKPNARNYITYKLGDNPETVYMDMKQIFQEQLLHKSNQDRLKTREEIQDICDELEKTYKGDWNDIRKKKIKDPIIRRYILSIRDKYELDNNETEDLTNILKLGFLFNWIPNEAVIYNNQEINDITSLHFKEESRTFVLDEPEKPTKREYKPKTHKLSDLWDKHLSKPKNSYSL